jgi:L-ascorbate metabolism protein UlaG (beta-lactamase superfamily)
VRNWILLGLLLFASTACAAEGVSRIDLADGEAQIRYLGHAGWLVRTSQHILIFDYTGTIENGNLEEGTLSPELLTGCPVLLFISHAHGDHFGRNVLNLSDGVEDLLVVMGWDEPTVRSAVVPVVGKWTEVSGAEVFALHHEFDGIPEGFFLVRSGGLTIYHSGDHGTWVTPPSAEFRDNIDRLVAAAQRIDIAFISAFGRRDGGGPLNEGDIYGIRTLRPRVTFPMHLGGREGGYATFAEEATRRDLPTTFGVAGSPGALFHYEGGGLH